MGVAGPVEAAGAEGPEPFHRFRDEALARVTSSPPDADYERPERAEWRARVARLARRLDALGAVGTGVGPGSRTLVEAFWAFVPLVDPEWWRSHPPVKLRSRDRRRLKVLRRQRKSASKQRWARQGRGEVELWVCEAMAVFTRVGDEDRYRRCLRLLDGL